MVQFNLGRVMNNRSSISALHLDKFSTFFRLVYFFFQEEITILLSSQLNLALSYRFTPEAQNRFLFIFFFESIAKTLKRLKKNDTLLEPINLINREQIYFSSMFLQQFLFHYFNDGLCRITCFRFKRVSNNTVNFIALLTCMQLKLSIQI